MRRRGALLVVLLAAGVGACGGGGGESTRERLNDYVRSANTVERRFAEDFKRANDAYAAYARGELEPARAEADLARAETAIRSAREAVARLRPPGDARTLHARLLRYLDMNVTFAGETARLAVYTPGAEDALAPLERVNRQLNRRLSAATEPAGQADALRRFTRALDGMLRELRGLEVPAVLEPTHGDQVRRLAATRSLAGRLRAALLDHDAQRVARLLERFRANREDRRTRRKLAGRAIRQYERRYRALIDAYADVHREQARLDRALRER
jgi:hypothetical protein